MTLTEFLLARLDEDEADWQMVASRDVVETLRGQPLAPRMLADVEAKRQIIREWRQVDELDERKTSPAWAHMTRVMWVLAQPYADHPDYDQSWAPS